MGFWFLCVHKTQEVIIDYILWCQIYFLKRGQRRFWSLFQYFPHFFHSFSHYSCVPSCCCSFIQSFISVTVIFFLLLISFCPLFLCFCFVVTLHLFSVIIGAFHPSSFFRVFLNLFAFFLSFVISSSCPAPASSLPSFMISFFRSFVLSFFVPFVSTANNPSNSKFSHAFLVAQACFIPSCPPVSALLLTGLHCTCTASISFSLFCLSSLSIWSFLLCSAQLHFAHFTSSPWWLFIYLFFFTAYYVLIGFIGIHRDTVGQSWSISLYFFFAHLDDLILGTLQASFVCARGLKTEQLLQHSLNCLYNALWAYIHHFFTHGKLNIRTFSVFMHMLIEGEAYKWFLHHNWPCSCSVISFFVSSVREAVLLLLQDSRLCVF